MQKGEVVEEGDHDSLMRAQGTYFGLVEQQNLRQAEEEEELEFERQETVDVIRTNQVDENHLDVGLQRKRGSSIISLTPSIYAALHGKNESNPQQMKIQAKIAKKKRKK